MLLRGNVCGASLTQKTAKALRLDLLVNLPQITGETGGEPPVNVQDKQGERR
jgi:hypothetical protein